MAIIQAFLSLLSRSLGKIVNAIFGWAVVALFGRRPPKEQTLLSVLVGAAALWPLLLVGVALPRAASLVLAFAPIPKSVPAWIIRLVWIALAAAVPITVGLVVAAKAPPDAKREPVPKRIARGLPITIALAAALLLMLVTVPVLRLISVAKRRRDEHVPLIAEPGVYQATAAQLGRMLDRHGFHAPPAKPPWWMTTPTGILRKLGGDAFRGYVPEQLAFFRGRDLEAALYPSGLLLRGKPQVIGWAHALAVEDLAHSEALQTTDLEAQKIEQRIHGVWQLHDSHPELFDHAALQPRLDELAASLADTKLPFDEWQVLYRQVLQLGRAVDDQQPLLERSAERHAPVAAPQPLPAPPPAAKRHERPSVLAIAAGLAGAAAGALALRLVEKPRRA